LEHSGPDRNASSAGTQKTNLQSLFLSIRFVKKIGKQGRKALKKGKKLSVQGMALDVPPAGTFQGALVRPNRCDPVKVDLQRDRSV
jgi:hypothetical protein